MATESARHKGMYFADHFKNGLNGFILTVGEQSAATSEVNLYVPEDIGRKIIQDAFLYIGINRSNYFEIESPMENVKKNLVWLFEEEE